MLFELSIVPMNLLNIIYQKSILPNLNSDFVILEFILSNIVLLNNFALKEKIFEIICEIELNCHFFNKITQIFDFNFDSNLKVDSNIDSTNYYLCFNKRYLKNDFLNFTI